MNILSLWIILHISTQTGLIVVRSRLIYSEYIQIQISRDTGTGEKELVLFFLFYFRLSLVLLAGPLPTLLG